MWMYSKCSSEKVLFACILPVNYALRWAHGGGGDHIYIWHSTALGSPTPPPPRGWSWFPAPPPVGVGGVVVDGWECWLMES